MILSLSILGGSFSSHLQNQHLLFISLTTAMLTGVEWNLNAVLVFMSLMAMDVEHFFMYFLAICTSFENSVHLLIY
jgi:hypothetical protein